MLHHRPTGVVAVVVAVVAAAVLGVVFLLLLLLLLPLRLLVSVARLRTSPTLHAEKEKYWLHM